MTDQGADHIRLARRATHLRTLTNFGWLATNSPLLDVDLSAWYCLPPEPLGQLPLPDSMPIWLSAASTQALDAVIHQTITSLRGFARITRCSFGYQRSPTTIQGVTAPIPLTAGAEDVHIAEYVASHALEGQMTSGLILDFETLIACRSVDTYEIGDYWLGDVRIRLGPDTYENATRQAGAEGNDQPPGVTWTAYCSSTCASLYRRDNDRVLADTRAYWQALQKAQPGVSISPEDPVEVYQMAITEMTPAISGIGNAELWSINYPRLTSAIANWEQAMSSAFRWQPDLLP